MAIPIDAFSHSFRVSVIEEAVFGHARTPHLANLFGTNARYVEIITRQQAMSPLAV